MSNNISPDTRTFIDDRADGLPDLEDFLGADSNEAADGNNSGEAEDSWIDELELYTPNYIQPDQAVQTQQKEDQQDKNFEDLFDGLEYADEDATKEVYSKIISPELQKMRQQLEAMRQQQTAYTQEQQNAILRRANDEITRKHPKASKILQSREFIDYINSRGNPYAQQTESELLNRAYYMGDSAYVISKLDDFVTSRGKPRPQAGVEAPRSGGGSNVSGATGYITESQFNKMMHKIKTAPPGTYPKGAAQKLFKKYMEQNRN